MIKIWIIEDLILFKRFFQKNMNREQVEMKYTYMYFTFQLKVSIFFTDITACCYKFLFMIWVSSASFLFSSFLRSSAQIADPSAVQKFANERFHRYIWFVLVVALLLVSIAGLLLQFCSSDSMPRCQASLQGVLCIFNQFLAQEGRVYTAVLAKFQLLPSLGGSK
jgi:hypothetical protein